ncbi:hypothetical protein EHM69_12060, partial [candidate division KSB1 bacterium]
MNIRKSFFLLPLFLIFAVSAFGQSPWQVELLETGSTVDPWALDAPMDSICSGTGHTIADGTVIKIYWDNDSTGQDADDPLMPLCDDPPACVQQTPAGSVNFNEMVFNSDGEFTIPGYFMSTSSPNAGYLTTISSVRYPNRFYLRILLPSIRVFYESPIYSPTPGTQSTQECSWTCFTDSVITDCEDPHPVQNFQATDSTLCTGARLTWTHPDTTELNMYRIFRGGVLIDSVVNTVWTYLDVNAPTGQTLIYSIRCYNYCGAQTGISEARQDTGSVYPPPVVPDAIMASYDTCNYVRVRWRYTSGAGTESFRIKRNDTTVTTQAASGNPGWRTWDHITTDPATANYTVVGYSTVCGEGTPSAADPGYALQPPPPPDSIIASDGLCNYTLVYWRNVPGATTHKVYRYDTSGGNETYVGNSAVSPYSDGISPAGTVFRYRVSAQNACGEGGKSVEFDNGWRVRKVNKVATVTASDSSNCDTVTITWSNITMEDSFKVIRQPVLGSFPADTIARLAADTLVFYDLTATPGVRYNYRLLGKNVCGNGDTVSTNQEGSRKAKPGRPGTPIASDGTACNGVVITWPDVAREDSFIIYRNDVRLAKVNANIVTYTDLTADTLGTRYGYTIMACNMCGCSTSVVDSGYRKMKPERVTGLAASDTSCTNIYLIWNNIAGEDNYRVIRNGGLIATLGANITNYTDNPAPGTYEYKILAINSCGNADTSLPDSGTKIPPPPIVDTVWASDDLCPHVLVEWSNVAGEDSFQIRRNGARLDAVAADVLSYTDISAVAGTRYKYTVAAYNACGAANPTVADSGGRRAVPDSITYMYATENNCDSVFVSWMSIGNVDTYYVYRNGDSLGSQSGLLQFFVDRTATP